MPASPPPAARQYRAAMWLFALLGLVALVPAIQGARGTLPRQVGVLAAVVSVAGLFLAAAFGLRGRRVVVEAREREASRLALVMLAGMLKDRPLEELDALSGQEGSAGEAARMLLDRRREDEGRARRPPKAP